MSPLAQREAPSPERLPSILRKDRVRVWNSCFLLSRKYPQVHFHSSCFIEGSCTTGSPVASAPLSTGVTSPLAVGSCLNSERRSSPDLPESHRHSYRPVG